MWCTSYSNYRNIKYINIDDVISLREYIGFFSYNGNDDTLVILYGNDVETRTDFIASKYNSSYGFFKDGDFVSKGDPWWLCGKSGWITVNDSLVNGAHYDWGAN